MKVNVGKTEMMVFEKSEKTTACDIFIEDEKVEQVKEFIYSGILFTNDRKYETDIERKVNAENKIFLIVISTTKWACEPQRVVVTSTYGHSQPKESPVHCLPIRQEWGYLMEGRVG
ncbi:hypothetical protein EVAR_46827_1 [Eumeta japonica]|uniref:Uncharacterized protein n=1 Tax=Eumeta variegata TaxID=151549 RepID=A0A4C2AAD8_EUMVA|nr:hypothetical protein EVAR_46827_1 [Eumeta japonica]